MRYHCAKAILYSTIIGGILLTAVSVGATPAGEPVKSDEVETVEVEAEALPEPILSEPEPEPEKARSKTQPAKREHTQPGPPPKTGNGNVRTLKPAIIAEDGYDSWLYPGKLFGLDNRAYYLVKDQRTSPLTTASALVLSGHVAEAEEQVLGTWAAGLLAVPLGVVGTVALVFGGVFTAFPLIYSLPNPDGVTPEQAAELGQWMIPLGVALLGISAVAMAGALFGGMWLYSQFAPSKEEVGKLDNIEFIKRGTLSEVLAKRICDEE